MEKLSGLSLILLCAAAVALLPYCRKDREVPYSEQVLLSEPFDSWQSMSVTTQPLNLMVDSTQVGVSNGRLELTFNPANFDGEELGCEWERFGTTSPYMEHIGVRVVLDSGYFQRRHQYIEDFEYRDRYTTMWLLYSDLSVRVPSGWAGYYPDPVVDPGIFRIEGRVLEFIRDGSAFRFYVDGIAHPLSEVDITSLGYSHHWLHAWFEIGRTNEPDTSIDHLGIDKVEIFTWTGERPD